jgi:hypothetical protein
MSLIISTRPVLGIFVGARKFTPTDTVSYDDGPIALQNPINGLRHQIWRMRYVNDTFYLVAPNRVESAFLTVRGVRECNFTFDQNGRILITYIVEDVLTLCWHDTFTQRYEKWAMATGVTSAKICLDMRDPNLITKSQILLGYIQNGSLYYCKQLERYKIARLIASNVGTRLIQIGLSRQNRFQYLLEETPKPVHADTYPWGDLAVDDTLLYS